MNILITGGTGLIGQCTAAAVRSAGHSVRLLARHAEPEASEPGLEYRTGSVTDPASLVHAAQGCDVVLHVAGIVSEDPPERTFLSVNVEGTHNVVREAEASGVRRLVYLSSFGADTGTSNYHKSKLAGERAASEFPGEVIIVRLGNVYGPGDEVISALVKMVRALPVFPVIDSGDQPFQPIWHDDAGAALAQILTDPKLPTQPLNLLGPDVVTVDRLLDIVGEITGQKPLRIPVPSGIAGFAARFADAVGIDIPLKPDVLHMLLEGNVLGPGQVNHLEYYVEQPMRITSGMRSLLESMPEQDLDEGHGTPLHRRFVVDIVAPKFNAGQLFRMFCADYDRFLPVERSQQKGNPHRVELGRTITLALPLRGDISVRVEEAEDNAVTFVTVDGHPLAGFVRFTWGDTDRGVRYEINVYDRPATLLDTIAMTFGGSIAQRYTWKKACEHMVEESGGTAPDGVQHETKPITEEDAERVKDWLDRLRASRE